MVNITAPYNLTSFNNATDIYGFASASNTVIGNILGIIILFLAFIVPFIALKGYDTKVVFVVSSAVSTIIGLILLTHLQWIDINIFWFPLLSLVASVVINLFARNFGE